MKETLQEHRPISCLHSITLLHLTPSTNNGWVVNQNKNKKMEAWHHDVLVPMPRKMSSATGPACWRMPCSDCPSTLAERTYDSVSESTIKALASTLGERISPRAWLCSSIKAITAI